MPCSCWFRWPRERARALLRAPALIPSLLVLVTPLTAVTAHAQQQYVTTFRMDLDDVSKLYDSVYRHPLTEYYLVDSTLSYDWRTIPFGNQRSRVPSFLKTDADTTRRIVDDLLVPGYRVVITVPRTVFFEQEMREVGELMLPTPRDFSLPALQARLIATPDLATSVMRDSRAAVWRESARANVTALSATTTPGAGGGIVFDIPLPMPKSLESIFGPGEKTSITIRGREEITIAGKTQVIDPYIGVEGRQDQSLFPSLDMEQKLDVNLTGTIGDKVSIQVDHSSQAIGDDANRVRLAYTGYEDEVIQLIELGNTSLSLPGSQLVSVSTSAQGLFGMKMLAKMGSTDITAIASKQEGEAAAATFSPTGGTLGQTETRLIRDVDYVKNKYFYVNNPNLIEQEGLGPDVSGFEVYRSVTPLEKQIDPNLNFFPGWAFPDSANNGDGLTAGAAPIVAAGGEAPFDFQLLERGIDYEFILEVETRRVVGIELFNPIAEEKVLALRYTTEDGTRIGGTLADYGAVGPGSNRLVLELIKPDIPKETDVTWDYMFRNIYNLGLTNIDGTSLEITIEDILNPRLNAEVPEGSEEPYLRIFGLDQTDRTGTGAPDGRIDLREGLVNLTTGLLQFPSFFAFAPDSNDVDRWTDGRFQFSGPYRPQYDTAARIYTEKLTATTEAQFHQYIIRVSAVSTSKTFRINALNIVENSEVIRLDGKQLVRNSDYTINYDTGEVELKESALSQLTPDSKITIDYEFKPLGGIGSSTLAGISTVSKIGENARIGTTFLYESRSSATDRPRLGEEPTRAVVGGITASYQHQSQILTDVANWLPYVDTDAPSTVQIDGEIAGSLPNPNTKNEAYIDDFEGVEDTDRLPMARRSWYAASVPVGKPLAESSRHGLMWYNIEPELGVRRRDFNPELDEQENTLVQSLDIELSTAPDPADADKYAGLITGFPEGGLDFTQGQFIEIWVNDFKPDPLARAGRLHIDMGIIDENFHEMDFGDFDDEDKNRDGFAAAFDDTGLDGLFNNEELGYNETSNPDPNGDDIDLRRLNGRFTKVNGTEGNRIYDTEDLDRNGQLNRDNAYFSFVVDLADTAEIDIRRQYPGYNGFTRSGHENDAWRLYRVKLTDYTVVSPSGIQPRFDEIRHLRVWFEEADQVVRTNGVGSLRLQISEFAVEGNRWEVDGVRNLYDGIRANSGADFAIGVISTKTDPGVYNPPVRPNTVNEVADKESSLSLRYTSLPESTQVRILKRFAGNGLDMTLYRDLTFWVHTDSLRAGVEYYFRLATNEQNYYEVQVPFTSDYYTRTGWALVSVDVADLTNLKFEAPDSVVTGTARDLADPDRTYPIRMRGAPNLSGVRFLYAGVRNHSNPGPQSGEVWINDVFTGGVLRDFDHAERVSANLSVAGGAVSLGGNWSRTGADYRGLRQTRGSGADLTTLGLNARTDLQYFLPLAGFSIPLTGTFNRSRALPKFPPNSDTEIQDAAISDSLRTERVTRGFTTSLSRRVQAQNFLMRYTLDRIKPTFSYSDSKGIAPAVRDTTTNMTGSLGYQLTWSGDKTFPLFGKNRMRWWLNSLDFSTNATRQTTRRWSLRGGEFRRDPFLYNASLRNQGTVRYNPFRSLESTFSMSIARDVGLPQDWLGVNVGREVGRTNSLRLFFDTPDWVVVRLLDPTFEVQSGYNEDSSPHVRRTGDPAGTRNVGASRNDTARMRFDIGRHMTALFKRFGWDPAPPPAPGGGAGQGRTGDGTPGAAEPDTSAPDRPKAPRPGLGSAVKGIGRMLTRIQPLNANVQHRVNSSYQRVPGRPDLAYRLGASTSTGLSRDGVAIDKPDTRREDLSYNLNSGVRLVQTASGQNVDVQARYTRATNESDFRESRQHTVNSTWPDLQLKVDNLHQFAPLRPILAGGELTVDYRETRTESGVKDEPPTTIGETFTLSPSLLFTWKNELTSTLGFSFTENSSETRGSKSVTNNLSINLDLRKTFRAGGGFSFFGKDVKWTNQLEGTMAVAYTRSGGERFTPGSDLSEPVPGSTSFRVAPRVSYYFNRNINGSAFIDYGRQYTEALGQTITTVSVGISALINF